jgi:hypothetical protein
MHLQGCTAAAARCCAVPLQQAASNVQAALLGVEQNNEQMQMHGFRGIYD